MARLGSCRYDVIRGGPPLEAVGNGSALVITAFSTEVSDGLGGGRAWTRAGRPVEAAAPLVDVSLFELQTQRSLEVRVADDTPIYVRVALASPEANWICAAGTEVSG